MIFGVTTAASDTAHKNRISPIFCALLDAAVTSDTENHTHVNRPLTVLSSIKTLHVTMVDDEK
jgi:hypothetical protein